MNQRRRVTAVRRDEDGDLVALCNPDEKWSPIYVETVIRHLSIGLFEYYVSEAGYLSYVTVDESGEEETLFASADPNASNNLENLPEPEAVHAA